MSESRQRCTADYYVGNLPDSNTGWKMYRKKLSTKAIRIIGPFTCATSEGIMRCEDGYLALDSKGNPYPIARDVFEQTYVEE